MRLYDAVVRIVTSPEYIERTAKGISMGIEVVSFFVFAILVLSCVLALIAVMMKFEAWRIMHHTWKRMSMDELIAERKRLAEKEYLVKLFNEDIVQTESDKK